MAEHYIPAELRRLVMQRAGNRCEYCGAPVNFSSDTFTFDHIVPRSLGGLTTADNLALACFSCNQHKAARLAALDPVTGGSVPLFHNGFKIGGDAIYRSTNLDPYRCDHGHRHVFQPSSSTR